MFISNRRWLAYLCMLPLGLAEASFSPFVDILYWNTSEQTASVWSNITTFPSVSEFDYQVANVDFNWKPGIRGGFLYEPTSCFWGSRLYWTYFSTDKKVQFPALENLISPELFSSFLSLDLFAGANLDWRIALNMLDYNISHAFPITDYMIFRPSIGLKAGTIRQHIHIFWDAIIYNATEKVTNNFAGIGPTFGLDINWELYKNFILVADLSTAFMWGNWKIKDVYNRPGAFLGFVPPTTITTSLSNAKLGTVILTTFLGLAWTYHGTSDISIELGYEMQYWPNQLRMTSFEQLPTHGDLTLQGATCRVHIDL